MLHILSQNNSIISRTMTVNTSIIRCAYNNKIIKLLCI